MDYNFILYVAVILLSTKGLGMVTRKFKMPQVVGALLAGLLLGPAVLNLVHEDAFISQVSELGVIVLMFTAGMETDIKELKRTGKASFVIALIGVLVPLAGGFGVAWLFDRGSTESNLMLKNIFIGIILTATSVSITVETLKEMGKLSTRAGNAILGAAIIDDVLGIVALTIVTSMADTSVHIWLVLLKIAGFFVVAALGGFGFYWLFNRYMRRFKKDLRRFVILSFVFCLVLAFCAETFFGVADITGAFIAGLVISNTKKSTYIASRFETLSYMFLSPMFFASIGLKVELPKMSLSIVLFAVLLTVVAVLTKIVGCGLGAKLCKYSSQESVQIGVGMISRGEVALIVAMKGEAMGLMPPAFLGPVIITVVVTTIITPILLKLVFRSKSGSGKQDVLETDLTKHVEKVLDYTTKERES